jgi:CPA1 family monovalent cation:H+ antiporter
VTILQTVLWLLAAAIPLALIARRYDLPYAVTLVVGGMALAFVPFLPEVAIEPSFVLVFFLPPLLQASAFFMPWRAFRADLGPILLLAVGLVGFTTLLVGIAAHLLVPGLPWAVCFALGAIVSPPDAVAAASVLEKMRIPRRLVVILEGESLVNDASGLILYNFAIAAALTGSFSAPEAALRFGVVATIGVAIGIGVGLAAAWAMQRLPETMLVIATSFLAAYASYIIPDQLGGSGVLGTVSCGLVLGWRAPKILTPQARVAGRAAWDVVVFMLNTVVFLLIGMSLDEIVARTTGQSLGEMILIGLVLSAVAILVRFVWVFPAGVLARLFRLGKKPSWRTLTVVSWAGMRGVVSLAAALAIPETLADGATPFPGRDLVQVLTFVVILVTLVGQATTLGPLIRHLGVALPEGTDDPHAATRTRIAAVAVEHLRDRAADPLDGAMAADLLPEFEARAAAVTGSGGAAAAAAASRLAIYLETKRAQHAALIRLHRTGQIEDETLNHLQDELDLDELRMRRALGQAGTR